MTKLQQIEKSMMNDTCERAFLLSMDGDSILLEKKDDSCKGKIEFTAREKELFKGNILTHSHHHIYGARLFTQYDIDLFFHHKLREMRMVRGNIVKSLVHLDSCNRDHSRVLTDLVEFGMSRER